MQNKLLIQMHIICIEYGKQTAAYAWLSLLCSSRKKLLSSYPIVLYDQLSLKYESFMNKQAACLFYFWGVFRGLGPFVLRDYLLYLVTIH